MFLFALLACGSGPSLAERPLTWDVRREQLTRAYLARHCGDCPTGNRPVVVVLHGTGADSIEALHARFDPVALPSDRADLAWAGKVNLSTHFAVDRDGGITHFLADERVGRHTVGLNHASIGIENLGDGPTHELTAAQVAANASLVRMLAGRHDTAWLVGHHRAHQMACTEVYRQKDETYSTYARDPGDAFVAAVAAEVVDLGLRGPPSCER